MKMTFRWYGEDDKVKLAQITQIPAMSGVVSAIYSVPVGEVWPLVDIQHLKEQCQKHNLEWEVVESVPVHEDIKLRRGNYQQYIENYKTNIRLLASCGIKCICYNFMPVFDWTRSELNKELLDGSKTLVYYKEHVDLLDPNKLALPGWDASYSPAQVKELIEAHKVQGEEGLWASLDYFLKQIIPVAIECDVNMAIHPDDPPWSIFSLPRIINNEQNIKRFLKLYDDKHNGITLCSGSLGCAKSNDLIAMIHAFGRDGKIHFAHLRNVLRLQDGSFEEVAHYSDCGSLDMYAIIKALNDVGFDGYVRPDHGRMIWEEVGRPGYGLYDRALGAAYINGLWEAIRKGGNENEITVSN